MEGQLINILESLTNYPEIFFLVSFIFLLFAGEPIVLGFTFLAISLDIINTWQILLFAITAAIFAETFWFVLAKAKILSKNKLADQFPSISNEIDSVVKRIGLNSPIKLLFLSRLISGVSIVVIVILSQRGLGLKRFLFYSLIVNLFWSSIIVTVGYLMAIGYGNISESFLNITYLLEIGIASLLLIYLIYRFIARKLALSIIS